MKGKNYYLRRQFLGDIQNRLKIIRNYVKVSKSSLIKTVKYGINEMVKKKVKKKIWDKG